ncbi:MAG TPA: extracellular solute-binding protein [Saprospiraceae bacterium]|nr:extracellular solute-binding protein [Saprospiraceae bacterium]
MLSRLLVFTFFIVVLYSCRNHDQEASSLVFWSSNNAEEVEFSRIYIERWNKAGTGKPILSQPVPEGQSSEEVILAAVVGKTTPDMYSNMWQGDVEDFAQSGVLIALDTLDGFLDFMYERCDSSVIREITSQNGRIYQVPWKVNPIMLMYNPKLFADAGITEVPRDYESYLEAGAKLREKNLMLGISETHAIWWQRFFNFLPLYYAASGGMPLVENGKAIFNNEYGVRVFTFLQKIYSRGYFPREQLKGQSDPFLASRVASTFTGSWTVEYNERFKPDGFEFEFYNVPVPDTSVSPIYSYGDPKNIVIFNTCRDPQMAWKFLKTMLTAEADKDFLELSGQFPRRKDLNTNPIFQNYLQTHPRIVPFAKQAMYVRGIDNHQYMKEVLDLISQEYEACVVFGRKDPREAINDAAKAVDLLYLQ